MRPADYAPPFDARDYVAAPTDPEDERIEVGVLVVGAGPAPTIRIPTSIRSSGGSVGSATNSPESNGGGKSAGLALTAWIIPAARGRAR